MVSTSLSSFENKHMFILRKKNPRYQPNVRLPATDAKIAACELIMVAMDRMEKRKNFSDCTGVETDLKVLEQTLLQIKHTLVKRLGFDIADDTPSKIQSSSRYSSSIGSLIGGNTGIRTSQVHKVVCMHVLQINLIFFRYFLLGVRN